MREPILPLHSAWLDLLILRMMEPCVNPAKPVWFVLDELASRDRKPEVREPGRAWLPGPEPAREAVRPGCRGHALAAGNQDIFQDL